MKYRVSFKDNTVDTVEADKVYVADDGTLKFQVKIGSTFMTGTVYRTFLWVAHGGWTSCLEVAE